jgi:nucleoside-diphosphate-sugar epimerase
MDCFSLGRLVEIMGALTKKKVLVCGAGGFIGSHLVESLKNQGHHVIGVDLTFPKYKASAADEFYQCDLREQKNVRQLITAEIDTIYQLAADMGGAGYIFTGNNDADIMHNSALINLNIAEAMVKSGVKNIFYTSSACMYPSYNQEDPSNPLLSEESAYPANPDSEYGWEKLFSERLYLSFARNHGLRVRIARLHNIFGPHGAWDDEKAKAPAALCRKVALSDSVIEVWGTGNQTRSFLYIDECIEGIHRIQSSEYALPLNLGSDRMISINNLVTLIARQAGKSVIIKNISGPVGVMGRNSHNKLIRETIGWAPADQLEYGIQQLYLWISKMINKGKQ